MAGQSSGEMSRLLQDALIASGHVSSAGLIRRSDSQIRASSDKFQMSKSDSKMLSAVFRSPAAASRDGLTVAHKAYEVVRADNQAIYLRDAGDGDGMIVAKTTTHLLIGLYKSTMQPAICIEAVETFAQYIRDKGS